MPGFGLTWSNDGTRLAYAVLTPGERRPAQLRLLTMDTGAQQVYRMPPGCEARGPRFAPDDQSLAISLACADGQYVATLDADRATSAPIRLTPSYHQVQAPSWSSDGRTIYFTATTSGGDTNDVTGTCDLFAIHTDGTGLRQITHAVPGERFVGATPYRDQFLIGRARGAGPGLVGWLSGDGRTFTPMTGPNGDPVVGNQPQLQP
jgi:Tol biopolymer transport system component